MKHIVSALTLVVLLSTAIPAFSEDDGVKLPTVPPPPPPMCPLTNGR